MKKALTLPGILLPFGTIAVYVYVFAVVGNSALDIHLHDTYIKSYQIGEITVKYWWAIMISWAFHLILGYVKPPVKLWSWLQVTSSIISLFILNNPFNKIPSRYYDYDLKSPLKIYSLNSPTVLLWAIIFMIIQIVFWVYGLRVIFLKTKR